MQFISEDAEIFYAVTGEGPPVVLLHPFPANRQFWMPAARMLASRYCLVIPDLRGHGNSTPGSGPAYMEKHAADIMRLCERTTLGKAVFAGVSIGGYILFEFWRRYRERVAGLILCDTRPFADSDEASANRLKSAADVEQQGTIAFINGMIPKLIGQTTRTNRPDLVDAARKMMLEMTVEGIAAVQRGMAARPDSTPTLKTINVPTLVICGEEDTLTPLAEAQIMHKEILGSRLEIIPCAGHYAVLEQHETAGKLIRGWLDGLKK